MTNEPLMPREPPAPPVRLRLRIVVPLIVFLGLAIHYLLPRVAIVQGSLEVVRTLRWLPLMLAVAAQALSYVANGSLLAIAVTFSGERLRLRRATAIVMAASTVCLVAGGVVGYAASVYQWTLRSGTRRETAAIASAVPTAFDTDQALVVPHATVVRCAHVRVLPPSLPRRSRRCILAVGIGRRTP
jgi:uncharacterized membrane protein YbhN (UPF0104 family)